MFQFTQFYVLLIVQTENELRNSWKYLNLTKKGTYLETSSFIFSDYLDDVKLMGFAGDTTLLVRRILYDHSNIHKLECMNPICPDVNCGNQNMIFGGQK